MDAGDDAQEPGDVRGRPFAVRAGTTAEEEIRARLAPAAIQTFEYNSSTYDALATLSGGAVVDDRPIAHHFAAERDLKVLGDLPGTESHYAMVFAKNSPLRAPVDAGLAALEHEGRFDEWRRKWLTAEQGVGRRGIRDAVDRQAVGGLEACDGVHRGAVVAAAEGIGGEKAEGGQALLGLAGRQRGRGAVRGGAARREGGGRERGEQPAPRAGRPALEQGRPGGEGMGGEVWHRGPIQCGRKLSINHQDFPRPHLREVP